MGSVLHGKTLLVKSDWQNAYYTEHGSVELLSCYRIIQNFPYVEDFRNFVSSISGSKSGAGDTFICKY